MSLAEYGTTDNADLRHVYHDVASFSESDVATAGEPACHRRPIYPACDPLDR
jgi:hypothetical protein